MVTGKVPFPGTQIHSVFPLILARKIDWPKDLEIEPHCQSLIEELLQLEPLARLGARSPSNDMTALKAHPFFEGIQWTDDYLINCGIK